MVEQKVNRFAEAISIGNFYMVEKLTELEKDKKRKEKKQNVYNEKKALLLDTFQDVRQEIIHKSDRRSLFCNLIDEDQRIPYLIDLSFTNPFAPYRLKFKQSEFRESLLYVCSLLNQDFGVIDDILKNQKESLRSHRKTDLLKVGIYGIGGIIVFGLGGWIMAPAIGVAIGAAAGLSGAASTAHGLALLGGGSLAMGGIRMSGGTWMITGIAAFSGLSVAGSNSLLLQLNPNQAKVEILKAQVTFKTVYVPNESKFHKVEEAIEKLTSMKKEIVQEFIKEERFNEKNADRIKELKYLIDSLNNAIEWMKKNKANA